MFRRLTTSIAFCAATLFAATLCAVPPLQTPWPCDTTYRITQGHNGGSHTGMGAWAWDIGIPVGGEVVAPADGVVRTVRMTSNVGGCDRAYANDANYLVVDFGDGTEALFLHLEPGSTNLQPGDRVIAGQPVGRVGLTGWVCGAHLHFQIQRTCNSWWCQSIPAQFEMYGDPQSGSYESNNCGPPPECGAVASRADAVVIDEEAPGCFFKYTSYWWSEDGGHDGHHYFTYATAATERETYGVWTFDIGEAGLYRVEAHIPDAAMSTAATYEIYTGRETFDSGIIDQSSQKGWVELGIFPFEIGEDLNVSLGDNTGEAADQRVKLAYDAIRLVPVDEELDPGVDAPGESDVPSDPSDPTDEQSDDPTTDDGSSRGDSSLDEGSGSPSEPLSAQATSGCSVAGTGGGSTVALIALLLGWVGLRRRR